MTTIELQENMEGWRAANAKLAEAEKRIQYLERVLTEHNRQYPHGTPGHVVFDELDPFALL